MNKILVRLVPVSTMELALTVDATASRPLRLVPSLQVVTSPLLDPQFALGPGKRRRRNPVYDAAWESLRNLSASQVRYQPWFPQPHKAIAALTTPDTLRNTTSWNFDGVLPMFADFMRAVGERPTLLNFATFPCWVFASHTPVDCVPPDDTANPDGAAYWYANRGERSRLRDPSGQELAEYFGRLFAYLSLGGFEDEFGRWVGGGPAYNLSAARGHTWEVFNEQEHGYSAAQYTQDYDQARAAACRGRPARGVLYAPSDVVPF